MTGLLPLRPHRARFAFWSLMLLALLVLGAGIGQRDPWPADEPRFNLVARGMVERGEYLITWRGSELYSDKPPAYMWTQVAAYALTGDWRVAFLLPSLLAALGCLWLLHDLGRRLWSWRAGWWASALLLFTFHFSFQAKRAQIDMVLLFLVLLSLYGLLRHLLKGPDWRWYALGWFAAGLGTLTKGVGVLSLLVLLPWLYARARGWRGLAPLPGGRDLRWWSGPPLFLFALALWLVPMLWATYGSGDPAKIAYADDLLFRQTAKRYVHSWDHQAPPWYYLGVIASLWLPANLLLPWLLPAWWRRLRRRHDARFLLPLGWALLLLLFFSASPGKRDVYILPALPMLLFAAAPLLPGLLRRPGPNRLFAALAGLLALALLGAGGAALLGEPAFETRFEAAQALVPASDSIWWMFATIGAGSALACLHFRLRRGALALAATFALLWTLAYGVWGPPLLNEQTSARAVMQRARALAGPGIELGLVAWQEQNRLQALPPVTDFGFDKTPWDTQWRRGKDWLAADPARRRLFVLDRLLDECVDRARAQEVGVANRRRWWLLPAEALIPGCVSTHSVQRD